MLLKRSGKHNGQMTIPRRYRHTAAWTAQGFVYVAFVIDTVARRIVGWRVSRTAHAGFVLDALEQALHYCQPAKGGGLVHHSDRGSQYVAIRYTEHLTEAGVEPSVGNSYAARLTHQLWHPSTRRSEEPLSFAPS